MMYWVRHITSYAYDQPVDLAAHLLHLKPRALPGQRVIHARIRCQPAPDHATETHDHFGNAATRIFIAAPHQHFEVTAEALVQSILAAPEQAVAAAMLPPELSALADRLGALSDGVTRRYFAMLPVARSLGLDGPLAAPVEVLAP